MFVKSRIFLSNGFVSTVLQIPTLTIKIFGNVAFCEVILSIYLLQAQKIVLAQLVILYASLFIISLTIDQKTRDIRDLPHHPDTVKLCYKLQGLQQGCNGNRSALE